MQKINILDHSTIDKIAAGEVVERPASVVKELTENSLDAGAHSVTVEIKDGGISLIRVTDDGYGIDKSQLENAFMRHATSKIKTADDLCDVMTMGFRGEAIASIAAVSRTEMITKVPDDITGISYTVEGGVHTGTEEVGAPDGTSVIVKDLFYNTLPRRKFLKKDQTEASYISDLMEHLAISRPDVSFKYIQNNMVKFQTSGDGDLREVIYRVFGRDMSEHIIPVKEHDDSTGITIGGYIGEPSYCRSNRDFEFFFVNHRCIESKLLSKAVEEGYLGFLMQHKFPFIILFLTIDTHMIDVNVHPSKKEIRLSRQDEVFDLISGIVHKDLTHTEIIPDASLEMIKKDDRPVPVTKKDTEDILVEQQLKDTGRIISDEEKSDKDADLFDDTSEAEEAHGTSEADLPYGHDDISNNISNSIDICEDKTVSRIQDVDEKIDEQLSLDIDSISKNNTLNGKVISSASRNRYHLIGQVFETYWLIEFDDKLLIMDQHAAHEKVMFEKLMKQYADGDVSSQMLDPPYIMTLSPSQGDIISSYGDLFMQLGYNIENFGRNEYAIRAVPNELYGTSPQSLLDEILGDLSNGSPKDAPDSIRARIATMSCKAAVKGNNRLSVPEAEALLDELMELKDPYHCPHGRPTFITISRYEMDRKFKRITG